MCMFIRDIHKKIVNWNMKLLAGSFCVSNKIQFRYQLVRAVMKFISQIKDSSLKYKEYID